MRARVAAGVLGCGIGLLAAPASAQAPGAAFPAEATSNAAAPVPPPTGEVPPATTAPPATPAAPPPDVPAPPPVSTTRTPPPAVSPETTPPKPVPSWSVGAGLFSSGSLMIFAEQGIPTYSAALEHRLGSRVWLALNARFLYLTQEAPVYSTGEANPARTYRVKTSAAGALLGIRYVFASGLVDVSGTGAAYLNYRHIKGGEASGLLQVEMGSRRELGLLLGMAVERELIEALALRLSLDLGSTSVAFQDSPRIDDAGVKQPRTLVSGRVGFALEPGLHLHFYF